MTHNKSKTVKTSKTSAEYRTLKLTMERDKYELIMEAINEVKRIAGRQGYEINEARALELLSADYLSGTR